MDVKFRKTRLDDEALIYQQSKDTVSREDLKKLPFKKKLQYFRDYYAKKTLLCAAVIVFVGFLLNTTIFNRSTCILSVICLNGGQIEDSEMLTEALESCVEIRNKNDYISVETFDTSNYQMNIAYSTRIAASSSDLIVCSYEDFLEQAERGIFSDLSEFLPPETYEALSDRILDARTSETDNEGNPISYSDPTPFGIDLSGCSILQDCGIYCTDPVLCVTTNIPNEENALKALSYFVNN